MIDFALSLYPKLCCSTTNNISCFASACICSRNRGHFIFFQAVNNYVLPAEVGMCSTGHRPLPCYQNILGTLMKIMLRTSTAAEEFVPYRPCTDRIAKILKTSFYQYVQFVG